MSLAKLLQVVLCLNFIAFGIEPALSVLELCLDVRQVLRHNLDSVFIVLQRHVGVFQLLANTLDVGIQLSVLLVSKRW